MIKELGHLVTALGIVFGLWLAACGGDDGGGGDVSGITEIHCENDDRKVQLSDFPACQDLLEKWANDCCAKAADNANQSLQQYACQASPEDECQQVLDSANGEWDLFCKQSKQSQHVKISNSP